MKAASLLQGVGLALGFAALVGCGSQGDWSGSALTGEYLTSYQVTVKPAAVTRVPPEYPSRRRGSGARAEVMVQFIVESDGTVREAEVIDQAEENGERADFEEAAVAAVRQWRFRPGEKDGRAVRVVLRVPVGFGGG